MNRTEAVTTAERDLYLCPEARLLADGPVADDYVYDGAGTCILLPTELQVRQLLALGKS